MQTFDSTACATVGDTTYWVCITGDQVYYSTLDQITDDGTTAGDTTDPVLFADT